MLAERGSGFALFVDQLDNLSNYSEKEVTFHTLHFSKNHSVKIGLSWDQEIPAISFLRKVEELTSQPHNVGLTGPRKELRRKHSKETKKRIDKSQISQPVGFRHNVSVSLENFSDLISLQLHLPVDKESENEAKHYMFK